jgi:ribose transport system permease protein
MKEQKTIPVRLPRSAVWYATAALFGASWVVAPGTLSSSSLDSMLPFAGILAIAAVGLTLVIQQRGIDLSIAGTITLASVMVGQLTANSGGNLALAIIVVLAICAGLGLVNGLVVGVFNVSPLVATLALNAIVTGGVLAYTDGAPVRAPASLSDFSLDKTLGISNLVWLALVCVCVVGGLMAKSIWGRQFVATGANHAAARAAGLTVELLQLSAYVGASVCYGIAGILHAGFVSLPNVDAGEAYLLPAYAAVVVGGTSFVGGRGNILGTAVAALFLSQLTQLVLSIGAPTSTQLVIQSVVIAIAAALQLVDRQTLAAWLQRLRRRPAPAGR